MGEGLAKRRFRFGRDIGDLFWNEGVRVGKFILDYCHWVFGQSSKGDFNAEARRRRGTRRKKFLFV